MPLVPVCSQNSSAVRWSDEPLPDDAKVILSGLAFSAATTSATVLYGDAAGDEHVGRLDGDRQQVEVLPAS